MTRRQGLILLTLFALALRVSAVVVLCRPMDRPQTYEHGEIARNLLAGRGFTVTYLGVEGPTSQQAPWTPFLLAGAYAIAGVDTPQAIWIVQALQCLVGAGLALAVAWLAWSLVPDRPVVGWIAGLGAAVYPTHIYMATHVQVVPWAAFVLTLMLAVVVSPRAKGDWRWGIAAGLLGGWLLLIEPILALALPIAAVALGTPTLLQNYRRGLLAMTAMTLTTLAVVSPWLIRNYRVHGELVFIKSTFGYAFWQGNHPQSWGTDKIPKLEAEQIRAAHDGTLAGRNEALWQARHETLYIDDVLLKPQGYARFQGLSEPARSRLLGDEAWGFIFADPFRYLRLCVQRVRFFLWRDVTNPKAADPLYRLSSAGWFILAIVGLVVGRQYWRGWWPTWSVFLVVMTFHALTIVSARFRIPLEPLTFVWCATAVGMLGERVWLFGNTLLRRHDLAPKRCLAASSTAPGSLPQSP
jgi:4-amino-4-deoxy-L-arabinose transferase-like glycosyltransferase